MARNLEQIRSFGLAEAGVRQDSKHLREGFKSRRRRYKRSMKLPQSYRTNDVLVLRSGF